MNKYLKNLSRIEFVVTTACTGSCKHCSQGDHKGSDNIDKTIASEAVKRIAGEYDIQSVMTFGGEPLLYPDTVCEIHKAAKEMSVPVRQLITNGYFSKDYETIKLVAENVAESGVNEILLSVDAFHQETIPIEFVKLFALAVKNTGVKIKVHPAWLVSHEDNNPYNSVTRELLAQFNRMDIPTAEGNVVFPAGNAIKYFGEYFEKNKDIRNPYLEDPTDIRAICISADGSLLGDNINSKDIGGILSEYAPENKI